MTIVVTPAIDIHHLAPAEHGRAVRIRRSQSLPEYAAPKRQKS
jgi:hypothetical protein